MLRDDGPEVNVARMTVGGHAPAEEHVRVGWLVGRLPRVGLPRAGVGLARHASPVDTVLEGVGTHRLALAHVGVALCVL